MAEQKSLTVNELISKTSELRQLFKEIESPEWSVETLVVELLAEVGTLADAIMITEGRRKPRAGTKSPDLRDDIADVLFMLLIIAQNYNIDVGSAYLEMVAATTKKLSAIISNNSNSVETGA